MAIAINVHFVVSFFCLCLFWNIQSIVIDTKSGKIEGIKDEYGTYLFQNIRYAQPPIDDLRWRAPEPLKDSTWSGIYNGTTPGNACVQATAQAAMMTNGSNGVMSEDCLTLAIQTPYDFDKPETQSLRPVLFWIHGGGLAMGTGYSYVGGNLPRNEDIVLVPINYRLGIAAWLVNPELNDSPTGNGGSNGFLDMIEALKWVRNNIESYGGDPNEITIAGESGGGWATCALLLSPLAKGLFKRSIQMSGSCVESLGKFFDEAEGWEIAKSVRDINNVTTFNELRDLDMQTIIDTHMASMKTVLPTIDGYVFPMSTMELVNNGYANGESTMIGTVFRESFSEKPFNMGTPPQSLEELNSYYYDKLFDTEAMLIQKYYPEKEIKSKIWPYGASEFDDNVASLIQTVQTTDCWVKCGSLWQADAMAMNPITRNSLNVYFYQYGYIEKPWDQVSHGYDIVGLFGQDIDWVNGGVAFSEEFVKITQRFFGDYVKRGVVPMMDGKEVSVQNGFYVQIVDKVRILPMSDLDVVRDRCEVYKKLGDGIWRNRFCMGLYWEDWAEMDWPGEDNTESCTAETCGGNKSADKQEI